jgi:SIR2-like domain
MNDITGLQQLHREGKLCLFVGAGVSMSCGLPDWDTLSKKVIEKTWPDRVSRLDIEQTITRSTLFNQNPLDAMRMARRVHGNQFNAVVSDCLYSSGAYISQTVKAIVHLGDVFRICCFNYDDLLEEGFRTSGNKCRPVMDGDELLLQTNEVLIFHPHGFLPRVTFTRNYSDEPIILSEDDYHELYAAPYSWANLIQINLLMSFSVLFVGCSLKDPSMRRLLDLCKRMKVAHRHYALVEDPTHQPDKHGWDLMPYPTMKKIRETDLLDRGVTPVWFNEYSDIPVILEGIAH